MVTIHGDSDRPRPSWRQRVWRFVKFCIVAAFALSVIFLIAGFCYEQAALRRIATDLRPPGKRVDIGGRALHLNVRGDGRPTVVFESGLGGCSIAWDRVAPQVAKVTRVVTYDRAGLGWSDPGPPASPGRVVDDLQRALHAAGVEGPYVLVGHSIGGLYMRMFSYRYPDEVAGMVLVDSSHEDQFDRFPEAITRRTRRLRWILPVAAQSARFGIPRMVSTLWGDRLYSGIALPADSRKAMKQLTPSYSAIRAVRYEFDSLPRNGRRLKAAAVPWNDMPLVVLTASKTLRTDSMDARENLDDLWQELQAELAARSTRATQRIVGGGHNLHQVRPEVVIEEIRRLVEFVRPLPDADAGVRP